MASGAPSHHGRRLARSDAAGVPPVRAPSVPPDTAKGLLGLPGCSGIDTLAIRGGMQDAGPVHQRQGPAHANHANLANPRPGDPRGLATLLAIAPTSASALTLHRAWSAKVGSSGANGTIALSIYTNDVGTIRYSLKGLRARATYAVQIRNGTCSSVGTIVARPPSVVTSTTGTVATDRHAAAVADDQGLAGCPK